jgi:hypothetical protein
VVLSTILLDSSVAIAHNLTVENVPDSAGTSAVITPSEFCLELEALAPAVDFFLVPREVFNEISAHDYQQLLESLKKVDWLMPPVVQIPAGMIPHFVVIEQLIPKSFTELDWGVELARYAEGRLSVLYAVNQTLDQATLTEADLREFHRQLYDKIAQTDYRTLENGTQLRIFPGDIISALTTIQAEYPPWIIIIPQSLITYQHLQSLDSQTGIMFLKQT